MRDLASFPSDDWTPDDIRNRNIEVKNAIIQQFKEWGLFDPKKSKSEPDNQQPQATEEELQVINELRKKGLI